MTPVLERRHARGCNGVVSLATVRRQQRSRERRERAQEAERARDETELRQRWQWVGYAWHGGPVMQVVDHAGGIVARLELADDYADDRVIGAASVWLETVRGYAVSCRQEWENRRRPRSRNERPEHQARGVYFHYWPGWAGGRLFYAVDRRSRTVYSEEAADESTHDDVLARVWDVLDMLDPEPEPDPEPRKISRKPRRGAVTHVDRPLLKVVRGEG